MSKTELKNEGIETSKNEVRPDRSKQHKSKKPYRGKSGSKSTNNRKELDSKGRDNDPNWYFLDAKLADQVCQMSFQQLAGYPIDFSGLQLEVPNIVGVYLNPCPGVIESADYANPSINRNSGINLAGFRIFSKLSAYTGRIATYGPQDISIMILAMGEVISCMEWCRRSFGIAFTSSMRNRSYPREVLETALNIDADDFFKNYADYRTRFNTLVTMVNQLPIPKGIAYFEKCAALYEKIYLDAPSDMAQSLIPSPYSTWVLDETTDPNGSMLVTTAWRADPNSANMNQLNNVPVAFSFYLNVLDNMINALLNSSSLQVVYTDLLNLANKVGQEFWKLDYIMDGYMVIPEFNQNFLLQMHNATIVGKMGNNTPITGVNITLMNNVVCNPNSNTIFYNPSITAFGTGGYPRTGTDVLIDMLTSQPTVVDRVEVTRYASIGGLHLDSGTNTRYDFVLPDHFVAMVQMYLQNSSPVAITSTLLAPSNYARTVTYDSMIDWAPRFFEADGTTGAPTGMFNGDLNFYTVVDANYLKRMHQFLALGLYDLR